MTDLQKVETVPSTQPAQANVEKPEVASTYKSSCSTWDCLTFVLALQEPSSVS